MKAAPHPTNYAMVRWCKSFNELELVTVMVRCVYLQTSIYRYLTFSLYTAIYS